MKWSRPFPVSLAGLVIVAFMLVPDEARPEEAPMIPPDPHFERGEPFRSFEEFWETLMAFGRMDAGTERDAKVDSFWSTLADANQIPFVHGDSVAFLCRSDRGLVQWPGDFNGWGRDDLQWGFRIGDTDLYVLDRTFPRDARLDYKILLNGSNWILDPENPLIMWGGFGPNSELRMPDYVYPMETVRREDLPRGTLGDPELFRSFNLGYEIGYRVYTPAGYDTLTALPVIYVTDGHEYAADHMGSMVVVLDNLIAEKRIEPVVAVFIDPREIGNPANNRRTSQYVANPAFANCVADELIPLVDKKYDTDPAAGRRAILGTSLGGLNSAYFGATMPDLFQKVAIQSPAFGGWRQAYDDYRDPSLRSLQIFLSYGTIGDGDDGPAFAALLEERGFDRMVVARNEGHSWGQWRALLDDFLVFFFPGEGGAPAGE